MNEDHPSLGLILEEIRVEADLHQRHWDAADTKAAAIGGFSAGAVALAVGSTSWLVLIGELGAGLAAGLALWALLPREMPLLQIEPLRDFYLDEPVQDSALQVLNARVDVWTKTRALLMLRAKRLRRAVITLGLAGALLIAGTLLDRLNEGGGQNGTGRPDSAVESGKR
jgi:hypothetical protein